MNYLRNFLLVASLCAVSSMPIQAKNFGFLRSSLLSSCYSYVSGWISPYLFATHEFVRREFQRVHGPANQINSHLQSVDEKIIGLERNLKIIESENDRYNYNFDIITAEHQAQLKKQKEALESFKKNQESSALGIELVRIKSTEIEKNIGTIHDDAEKINNSFVEHKTSLTMQTSEFFRQQEKLSQMVKTHFDAQNRKLDDILALVHVACNRTVQFAVDLDNALEEQKKQVIKHQEISKELLKVNQAAKEQKTKINNNLMSAVIGLQQSFNAKFSRNKLALALSSHTLVAPAATMEDVD